MIVGVSNIYSQNNKGIGISEQDTIAYMATLYSRKKEFIGQPLGTFIAEYKKHLPINFMGYGGTSPWIDPKGESYVNHISICYHDDAQMGIRDFNRKGNYILYIEFKNPFMTYYDFGKQFYDNMSYSDMVDMIKDKYIIKDIDMYLAQILCKPEKLK
jgi:hypothetical protein